jgi:hypothetical protein
MTCFCLEKFITIISTKHIGQNPEEFLQGVFVHGKTEGQAWVSGGINWAKAGRHFKLETCPKHDDEENCFLWKEMDPSHWYYFHNFFLNSQL